jgi:diaminohydroxyphosphoribosylaminopyrimidine deaminase/5-amino-6-(5-phosphoribosylamino)uracil reductase
MDKDELCMARAIKLARRGRYGAHPNPAVGAVVAMNGRIIGEGWHKEFGKAHAEINAIKDAGLHRGRGARGAVLYVTLEPCSTAGKTGPCTGSVIAAGIKRVVIGAPDPNPANAGRAAGIFKAAGIAVRSGVLAREAEALNPAFNKFMRTGLPYVTLKIAQSLDGKIADCRGRSRWISSAPARVEAHRLRAEADAVLAGINTVRLDDPALSVRHLKVSRQPAVVVLDSGLAIPPRARVFGGGRLILAATKKASARRIRLLCRDNVSVLVLPSGRHGGVELKALLRELGRLGVAHLLVEGGGRVIGSFVSQGLFDRFMVFSSPLLIGGEKSKTSVSWPDALTAAGGELGIKVIVSSIRRIGPDLLTELKPLSAPCGFAPRSAL